MLFFWNKNKFFEINKILKISSIIWQALLGRLARYLYTSTPLVCIYVWMVYPLNACGCRFFP